MYRWIFFFDAIVALKLEIVVEMCFLCLGCVSDKNETPSVVFVQGFCLFVQENQFQIFLWVDFQSYKLKLQCRWIFPHWKFIVISLFMIKICSTEFQLRKGKTVDYVTKLSKQFLWSVLYELVFCNVARAITFQFFKVHIHQGHFIRTVLTLSDLAQY